MHRSTVQPRQKHASIEHPAAVVLAVVSRVNELLVAVQSVHHDARRSAIYPERSQRRSVDQDAQSHRSRAGVAVPLKHSGQFHRGSHRNHDTTEQLKGRMS